MLYLAIVTLLVILSAKYDFDDRVETQQNKERTFWFVCFLFILIAGLRYNIGADTTDNYAPQYISFPAFGSNGWSLEHVRYQPGWVVFESICRAISPNFLLLQVVHALFINIVFFYFIHKYTKLWFTTALVYFVCGFLQLNTEVLRESMAVAFSLLAYDSVVEKKYARMALYAVMSYLFHVSGITVVAVVLLSFLKDTKKTRYLFLIIISLFVISYSMLDINTNLMDYLFYDGQADEMISQKLRFNITLNGWISHIFLWLVVPMFILSFTPIEDKQSNNFALMFILFIGLKFLTIYSFYFNRFANYFFFFYWITVSSFYVNISKKYLYGAKKVVLILLISFLFYSFYGFLFSKDVANSSFNMAYERYFPYRSVLEAGNTYYR